MIRKGLKNNGLLSTRIFASRIVFLVLLALMTALVSSVASAQEQQDPQEPKIYYLKKNQEQSNHWEQTYFWYEANGSGTVSVVPSGVTNSIFVVGNTFHLRPNRPNGPDIYYPEVGKYDTTFGYYHGIGSHTNKLYIGYKVDLTTGTVDLNDYSEGIYGVLHLKTQARGSNEGNITVDDLYVGRGEIFHGETNSTINLHGSVTVEGDLRFRNVAEDKNTDFRILNIYNEIHGDGMLEFEAGKSRDNHVAEIYLMSSENDFSGKVCVESGTHVHIDDPHEEHDFYDYQTHLFITGKNALWNAEHVLNEGFIYALADQRFKNYDGDDSFGQFTGVGELVVNPGVNVELLYDNSEFGDEPIGLITVKNENNNPGTLNFNIPEGMTKTITMSENRKIYSKIAGQGNIEKTGDGTLKIIAAAEGLVGAESFVVSSGRLDMEGYFEGTLQIGNDTVDLDEFAVFSPGNSVGHVDIDGDFILKSGATLLIEMDETGIDTMAATSFDLNGTISFTVTDDIPGGAAYDILTSKDGTPFDEGIITQMLNGQKLPEYFTLSLAGPSNNIVRFTIDRNAVPEPSTWALLILGISGLLYVRKRK